MAYIYKYPRHQVTVDLLLINTKNNNVLLIKRGNEPFKGKWAIPGGFVDPCEDLKTAAIRELEEETSVCIDDAQQFKTYGNPGRDPRGRNITIVYACMVEENLSAEGGDDASEAQWFSLNKLPDLGFDHEMIITEAAEAYIKTTL